MGRGFKDPYAQQLGQQYVDAGLPIPDYLFEPEPKKPNSGAQLAGAAVPAVATVGGAYLMKKILAEKAAESALPKIIAGPGAGASSSLAQAIAPKAALDAATGASIAPVSGVPITATGATPVLPGAVGAAEAAPSAFSLGGIGTAGNVFLPAAGAVGAYDLFKNKRKGARGIGQGAASGAAMGSYFGPVGAGVGAGVGTLAAILGGALHTSTAEIRKKHSKQLASQAPDNVIWQNYLAGMRDQPSLDKSKPFAGKYGSWDEYQKAGLDASDLTGVYGNLKAFGPEWAKLTFDQQKAVTQKLIDAGLYNSKKGEVEITDEKKAQDILKELSAKGFKVSIPTTPSSSSNVGTGTKALTEILRSKTRSPGIALDGSRIRY